MEERKIAWLSPKALDGELYLDGWTTVSNDWKRAHEIWTHAEEILRESPNESYLADAISNLKRAAIHRANLLVKTYRFDKMPITEKQRRPLEQLGNWGIIRPTMLRQLIDIRNAIEHEDAPPPNRERCLEFLDFVWYFLRSTDALSQEVPNDFEVLKSGRQSFSLTIDPTSDWKIGVLGLWSHSICSWSEVSGWFFMEHPQVIYSSGNNAAKQKRHSGTKKALRKSEVRKPDRTVIMGDITGSEDQLRKIIERYFFAITGNIARPPFIVR